MDYTFTEDQLAVQELAARIFEGVATPERVKEVAATESRTDARLWDELAKANLLGISLPERAGGSGLGMIEACLVLEQLGRRVAPVPLLWHTVASLAIAELAPEPLQSAVLPRAIDGSLVLSVALSQPGAGDLMEPTLVLGADGTVSGTAVSVPRADRVLLAARSGDDCALVMVDPAAGNRVEVETTSHDLVWDLTLDRAPAEIVATGQAGLRFVVERALVALCAVQLGVAEAALAQAAAYTSARLQFGKPLSSFQSTSARAADAYIDTEAIRATLWQAAWQLDMGRDAAVAVRVAKWWAAEAGQRVVHAAQHMHGGIGADIEYPVHRYFLWGKQLEDTLGGGSLHLAAIGRALAEVH